MFFVFKKNIFSKTLIVCEIISKSKVDHPFTRYTAISAIIAIKYYQINCIYNNCY